MFSCQVLQPNMIMHQCKSPKKLYLLYYRIVINTPKLLNMYLHAYVYI